MTAGGPASGILKHQLSAPKKTLLTPGRKRKRQQNKSRVQCSKKTPSRIIPYDMSQGLTSLVISQALQKHYTSEKNKKERSSPSDVTVCNFEDKGTFYCVVSILLCQAPWTVVAFTWEMGLMVSLGSISQLAVPLIQSSARVLAL